MEARYSACSSSQRKILVGATGCEAAERLSELCDMLVQFAEVKVVCTDCALQFINRPDFAKDYALYTDADLRKPQGQLPLYLHLAEWADLLIVAPLSADVLSKIAHGDCDSLLLAILRSWEFSLLRRENAPGKTAIMYPDMHACWWDHPLTAEHVMKVVSLGAEVAQNQTGRMFDPQAIVTRAQELLLH